MPSVTLRNSEVRDSVSYGIHMNISPGSSSGFTPTLTIENSVISANGSRGIYMPAASGGRNNLSIVNSTISQNGNDGIYIVWPRTLEITASTFTTNYGYPLSVDFYSLRLLNTRRYATIWLRATGTTLSV